MSSTSDLKNQLEVTIKALELKCQLSTESAAVEYLSMYKDVLKAIDAGSPDGTIKGLANNLLNCARGYMETSSNYQQDFLNEMGKTEKIIKQL